MKRMFTFMALASITMAMSAQSITVVKTEPTIGADYAGGCEIDLNNDGLKEVIISGWPHGSVPGRVIVDDEGNEIQSRYQSWVLSWDGNWSAVKEFFQLCGIRSHIIPADFNGDGNVDLYMAGEAYDYSGVYLNDGAGNFALDRRFSVKDADGNLTPWHPRAADVADFNQDGLPDIVTIGFSKVGGKMQANCGVLINQGDGTFKNILEKGTIGDGATDYEMALCTIKAYDLNNDGWPDILLQGNVDNSDKAASLTASGPNVPRTFMVLGNMGKDDDGKIAFYNMELATGVSHQMGNGNIAVADFNNDGTPDIFVTGESPNDARPNGSWAYYPQLLTAKINAKKEVTYTDNTSFVARGKDIRPLNSNNIGVRAIDYNGDGYYDLFYNGWCEEMLDHTPNTQAGYFLPGSAAGLTSYLRIPGASEHGIFFFDLGVQGALNYALTGYQGDATFYDAPRRTLSYTQNPYPQAARPNAPSALSRTANGHSVTLSWTPAASSMKNVTYECYLKETTTGVIYNNALSFIGGDKDGIRKVLREGNAFMNTTIKLENLPDGTYEWGVQTINAALRGSTFAKGQNIVIGTGKPDLSGISGAVRNDVAVEVARYNLSGQQINDAQRGINLIKMSDGTVRKVVVE